MAMELTTCTYCGCGCGLYLVVEKGEVCGVIPSQEHPISRGQLCVKGWNIYEFIHHPDRLKKPLIRTNHSLREASWNEALDLVAHHLKEIIAKFGSNSVGVLASAKCTNEENYLLMKFSRAVLDTNNIDHCARLCHASTVTGLSMAFGSGAMTNSINEIEDTEVILLTGSNPTEQHPAVGARIIKAVRKGAALIVVDPREIPLVKLARIYLQPKAGTDVAWINGMMHVILVENLAAGDFITRRTENFETFKKVVEIYTPQLVQEITGIPASDLITAAKLYGSSRKATIIYAMGITQHTTGTDNVLSLANLALLTGNIGAPSTGVNPLRGHNNVQGACDMGALPNFYSGYQPVNNLEIRKKFAAKWGKELPSEPGLTVVEMFNSAWEGKIKAMYIMGENPLLSDPNVGKVREALEKLDFLIIQDIFPSESSEFADVILPGASFAEKDGTFTNTERRIQRVRKAVAPPGEAQADWQIISLLAQKMGYPMNYNHPEEIMAEIASLTPIYGGISYPRLDENWGIQWPCPHSRHLGTPILHQETFTRGKGLFHPVRYIPPDELPNEEYPYLLTTGRIYFHFHTGTMTHRSPTLEREVPHPYMEINPQDAKRLSLSKGEKVWVSSRRGKIAIPIQITETVPTGTVFIPFHWQEAAVNLLTNPAFDPQAKIPEFKVCAVRIEKIE